MARMATLVAVMVLVVMTTGVLVAEADDLYRRISGKKFKINNVTPNNGDFTPACPSANPNTVAFSPSSSNPQKGTVKIVGQFDAPFIGVCANGEYYAVPPTVTIGYEVYGDLIVFRVPGRVATAAKFVVQKGVLTSVDVGNFFFVSTLTEIGHA